MNANDYGENPPRSTNTYRNLLPLKRTIEKKKPILCSIYLLTFARCTDTIKTQARVHLATKNGTSKKRRKKQSTTHTIGIND